MSQSSGSNTIQPVHSFSSLSCSLSLCQFTSMLDILEDFCMMRGFEYCRLDGSTNRVQRRLDIRRFNAAGRYVYIYPYVYLVNIFLYVYGVPHLILD